MTTRFSATEEHEYHISDKSYGLDLLLCSTACVEYGQVEHRGDLFEIYITRILIRSDEQYADMYGVVW